MWYNRISGYLAREQYKNNLICPCVFIKKTESSFSIVAAYVYDLNIIGTSKELQKRVNYMKACEIKDLEKLTLSCTAN